MYWHYCQRQGTWQSTCSWICISLETGFGYDSQYELLISTWQTGPSLETQIFRLEAPTPALEVHQQRLNEWLAWLLKEPRTQRVVPPLTT